jgi:hypothetical protein
LYRLRAVLRKDFSFSDPLILFRRYDVSAWRLTEMGRFLALIIVVGALIWWFSRSPETSNQDQAVAPASTPAHIIHAIGEEFSIGYWSYQCNGATRARMIPAFGRAVIPNGIFVVIDITVQNTDRSSSTIPPFHLIDADGREYDASSALTNSFLGAFEDLNPGLSKRGLVAFDVLPDHEYTLQVSGGIESGKSALVNITAPATPASEEPSEEPPQPPANKPSQIWAPPVNYGWPVGSQAAGKPSGPSAPSTSGQVPNGEGK